MNRSIKPDAIALGFFGLIAALAALIIAGSLIARTLQSDDEDLETLRSLGATPLMTTSASLTGIFGAIHLWRRARGRGSCRTLSTVADRARQGGVSGPGRELRLARARVLASRS